MRAGNALPPPPLPLTIKAERRKVEYDLHFPAGRALDGLVQDKSGRPLEGVEITLHRITTAESPRLRRPDFNQSDLHWQVTKTDAFGHFAFPGLGEVAVQLRAHLDGWSSLDRRVEPQEARPLELVMSSSPRIVGRLLDAQGEPVRLAFTHEELRANPELYSKQPRFKVQASRAGQEPERLGPPLVGLRAATALGKPWEHGVFVVDDIPGSQVHIVAVADNRELGRLIVEDLERGELREVEWRLSEQSRIEGRVLFTDGRVAPDHTVHWMLDPDVQPRVHHDRGRVKTDPQGCFSFEKLPSGTRISLTVNGPMASHSLVWVDTPERGGVVQKDFVLPSPSSLRIEARDAQGRPWPHARVQLMGQGPDARLVYRTVETDRNGFTEAFEHGAVRMLCLPLPDGQAPEDGQWRAALRSHFRPDAQTDPRSDRRLVNCSPGVAQLVTLTAIKRGGLAVSLAIDGVPAAQEVLHYERYTEATHFPGQRALALPPTDASGQVRVHTLRPGNYRVFVVAPCKVQSAVEEVTVQAGETASVRFELFTASVTGTIVSERGGRPLPKTPIWNLRGENRLALPGLRPQPIETDENGGFTIEGLFVGHALLGSAYPAGHQHVILPEMRPRLAGERIQLGRITALVAGSLRLSLEGWSEQLPKELRVHLHGASEPYTVRFYRNSAQETLKHLKPGPHRIRVTTSGRIAEQRVLAEGSVEIRVGEQAELTLRLAD